MSNPWTDKEVEQHWNNVAHIYVKENDRVKYAHDQRFRETIKHLNVKPGDKILNISSRDAEAADYIKKEENNTEIINAEISAGLMKVAQSIRPWIRQIKIETYSDLPFENEIFDKIITLETLEHASDPEKFLKELYRTAKKNSRLVLSCPPATSEIPYRIFTFLFGGHGEGPHRFLPSRKVKDLLKKTGWKLILHKGTVLIPVGPVWLQKSGENFINKFQDSFISELGIRQFFVCERT